MIFPAVETISHIFTKLFTFTSSLINTQTKNFFGEYIQRKKLLFTTLQWNAMQCSTKLVKSFLCCSPIAIECCCCCCMNVCLEEKKVENHHFQLNGRISLTIFTFTIFDNWFLAIITQLLSLYLSTYLPS